MTKLLAKPWPSKKMNNYQGIGQPLAINGKSIMTKVLANPWPSRKKYNDQSIGQPLAIKEKV